MPGETTLANNASNACPLCLIEALQWQGVTCTCANCSAQFEFDPPSRTLWYSHLPAAFAHLAEPLTTQWNTRDAVLATAHSGRELPARVEDQAATAASIAERKSVTPGSRWLVMGLSGAAAVAALVFGMRSFGRDAVPVPTPTTAAAQPARASLAPALSSPLLQGFERPVPSATVPPTPPALGLPPGSPSLQAGATAAAPPVGPLTSPLAPQLVQTVNALATSTAAARVVPPSVTAPPAPTLAATSVLLVNSPTPVAITVPPTFTPVPPRATSTLAPTETPEALPSDTPTSTPIASATPITTTATPTATVQFTITATASATVSPTATPVTTRTLVITKIKFRPDDGKAESDEFVEIRNAGKANITLVDWLIYSTNTDDFYELPPNIVMFPGDVCRFYSGGAAGGVSTGACAPQNLLDVPATGIWSVKSRAELINPQGATVSTCTYEFTATSTVREFTCPN